MKSAHMIICTLLFLILGVSQASSQQIGLLTNVKGDGIAKAICINPREPGPVSGTKMELWTLGDSGADATQQATYLGDAVVTNWGKEQWKGELLVKKGFSLNQLWPVVIIPKERIHDDWVSGLGLIEDVLRQAKKVPQRKEWTETDWGTKVRQNNPLVSKLTEPERRMGDNASLLDKEWIKNAELTQSTLPQDSLLVIRNQPSDGNIYWNACETGTLLIDKTEGAYRLFKKGREGNNEVCTFWNFTDLVLWLVNETKRPVNHRSPIRIVVGNGFSKRNVESLMMNILLPKVDHRTTITFKPVEGAQRILLQQSIESIVPRTIVISENEKSVRIEAKLDLVLDSQDSRELFFNTRFPNQQQSISEVALQKKLENRVKEIEGDDLWELGDIIYNELMTTFGAEPGGEAKMEISDLGEWYIVSTPYKTQNMFAFESYQNLVA